MTRIFRILFFTLALSFIPALAMAEDASTPTVNINTADATTLAEQLDGVGTVKAQAIVAYRQANGGFEQVDDLTNVKGIGESTLAKNRARIIVKPASE